MRSRGFQTFLLSVPVSVSNDQSSGRLMLLTIPMPRQLRCFDCGEAQYRIWALVRRCIAIEQRSGEPLFSVGVAFVGKKPPEGYQATQLGFTIPLIRNPKVFGTLSRLTLIKTIVTSQRI
ncbi:MAG: hypothetical protein IPI76_13295 [Chloracidobacterium sp.]|nr:hypothetical protein [Chloracidobacterium sp.]